MKTEFMPGPPKNWQELKPHPLSEFVEFGSGIDLDGLTDQMKRHGYDPDEFIILYKDGKTLCILDGRHRQVCAIRADVIPTFKMFIGSDPLAYVCKKAFRQHLTTSQRAMLAGKLSVTNVTPIAQNAENLHISRPRVHEAIKVLETGTPALQEAVLNGTLTVSDAAKVAKETPEIQNQAVKDVKKGKARTARKAVKKNKAEKSDADESQDDDAKVEPLDFIGQPIPKSLRDTFAGNLSSLENAVKLCQEIRRLVKNLQAWNPYMRPGEMETKLDELIEDFKNGKPYVVCEKCKGKGCSDCRKEGWLPKWRYEEKK